MQPKQGGFILYLILVFAVLFEGSTFAQQFNFRHLTDGPTFECYKVIQDRKGYIWISTEKGLCKYDGANYKWFNKDQAGKQFNSTFQLVEDSAGRILFNLLDDRIGYVYHDSVFFTPMGSKLQTQLKSGRSQILEMYIDDHDILWIGTGNGFFSNLKANDYSDFILRNRVPGTDSCRVGVTVMDNKVGIVMSQLAKEKYTDNRFFFHMYTRSDLRVNVYHGYGNVSSTTPGFYRCALLQNGDVLLAFDKTVYILHPDGTMSSRVFGSNIISIVKDREGGIWIGFWEKGLMYFADGTINGKPICSLDGQTVSSVIEDNERGIWATTLNSGVYYASTKNMIDFSKVDGMDKCSSLYSFNGNILTSGDAPYIKVIRNDSIRTVKLPANHIPQRVYDYSAIGRDLYIATGSGLIKVDTGLYVPYKMILMNDKRISYMVSSMSHLSEKVIYCVNFSMYLKLEDDILQVMDTLGSRANCIHITNAGKVLIGCTNGLYEYKNGKDIYLGTGDKLLSSPVRAIKEAKSGNIWIGTATSGVGLFKDGKIILTKSSDNGLPSNTINDIAFDSNGNVWVATDNGLSKINPSSNYSIEKYDTRHGLVSPDINKITINGNQLWIGGRNGVGMIDLKHFSPNKTSPPVYISLIYVNDKLNNNQNNFEYNLNNFRFHVVGLTFKDNKTRYIYRMIGIDTSWRNSNNAEIPFNNLAPGKYRFEVKAVNADDVKSLQPATFSFIIYPPFWLRWWFIVLEVFFGASLVYLFIQFRLRGIRAKEAEKSRIEKMLAEYQMTALSAQMNPHFVFNAINSIQDYVLGNDTQKAYDYLTKFAQLVRMILTNAKEQTISLEKEIESLNMYVALEQLRFKNKFEYDIRIHKDVDVYGIQVPSMIIQPYVENAIWHGLMALDNSRKGELKVELWQEENYLFITVEDNGIGREESKKIRKSTSHKSVGMEITKSRIEVLNNLLGTSGSQINIYDLYDDDMKPAGTRVEIKIATNTD